MLYNSAVILIYICKLLPLKICNVYHYLSFGKDDSGKCFSINKVLLRFLKFFVFCASMI